MQNLIVATVKAAQDFCVYLKLSGMYFSIPLIVDSIQSIDSDKDESTNNE